MVAEELVGKLSEKLGVTLKPLTSFTGEQLEHCRYQHPIADFKREGIVVLADYVTTESGTGLVHSAPGHGQDDFQVSSDVAMRSDAFRRPCSCLSTTPGVVHLFGYLISSYADLAWPARGTRRVVT